MLLTLYAQDWSKATDAAALADRVSFRDMDGADVTVAWRRQLCERADFALSMFVAELILTAEQVTRDDAL